MDQALDLRACLVAKQSTFADCTEQRFKNWILQPFFYPLPVKATNPRGEWEDGKQHGKGVLAFSDFKTNSISDRDIALCDLTQLLLENI